MDIYGEHTKKESFNGSSIPEQYKNLKYQLDTYIDLTDSVIYFHDSINLDVDFIICVRRLLHDRNDKTSPINLMVNSSKGNFFKILAIIDYIKSLNVEVNIICRGVVEQSMILLIASGTGTRFMSKQSFGIIQKSDDMLFIKMLSEKSNKNIDFWNGMLAQNPMLILSPEQLKEYNLIDEII